MGYDLAVTGGGDLGQGSCSAPNGTDLYLFTPRLCLSPKHAIERHKAVYAALGARAAVSVLEYTFGSTAPEATNPVQWDG